MKHLSQPRSISWFQEQYKLSRLELRPPFQRKPVWTDKQRSFLVESILLDVPIPEVYVQVSQAQDGSEEFGVVDGQQRLRTILQFIGIEREQDREGEDNNRFALTELPDSSPHKGVIFADITGAPRRNLFQYEICVRFLYTDSLKEVEDVFKRLNKFTMPLKAQELRNATFHGAFAKLSEELADNDYWAVNKIVRPAAIRRMADIEMMSDFLIALLHGPQGGAPKIIDSYYEQYELYDEEFPEEARVRKEFAASLSVIEAVFPDLPKIPRWGNRADFYSLFVAVATILRTHALKKSSERPLRERLLRFADEVNRRLQAPIARTSVEARDYARAIEKGSNDKARRTDRHDALLSTITTFFTARR
jgi:Protein of unknown function DUF262